MAYINFKEEKAKGKFQLDERKKNNEILYKSILFRARLTFPHISKGVTFL